MNDASPPVAPPSGTERDARIRHRAYEIWEEEGCPAGRAADHWDRATREVDQQTSTEAAPSARRKMKTPPDRRDEPGQGSVGSVPALDPHGRI